MHFTSTNLALNTYWWFFISRIHWIREYTVLSFWNFGLAELFSITQNPVLQTGIQIFFYPLHELLCSF